MPITAVAFDLEIMPNLRPDADEETAMMAAVEAPLRLRMHGLRMMMYLAATFVVRDDAAKAALLKSFENALAGYRLYHRVIFEPDSIEGGLHPAARDVLVEAARRVPEARTPAGSLATMLAECRAARGEDDERTRDLFEKAAAYVAGAPSATMVSLGAAIMAAADARRAAQEATARRAQSQALEARDRIADIARTVRLISLNARVEAARAGDAGRAFGVIAEEIKGLSEQTETASAEMGEGIEAIMAQWATA